MKMNSVLAAFGAGILLSLSSFAAGPLDDAVLHGETDRERAIEYAPGETMTFTLSLQGARAFPEGAYFVNWTRTGDDGKSESGRVDATTLPLVIRTSLDKPGFVRIEAFVTDAKGRVYRKSFTGDSTTPEGKVAMNRFERTDKRVFFDGGAGVQPEKLAALPEPKDFDACWARQWERLAKVPMKADRIELESPNPNARLYAIEIACAGTHPVTGYLSIPKAAEKGAKFPARIGFSGYGYRKDHPSLFPPKVVSDQIITLSIDAYGAKLPAFGADEAYYRAYAWEIGSNGYSYGFDPKQNEDPETAFFNGMVLRVKRGLQYLKSLPEWDGKDLRAEGGSQGGLQTIWAAGCGEGVIRADSNITWCCDLGGETVGRNRGGWYVHWVPALGYYDPVNFAKRIPATCLTTITRAGLGDYTCPPSGLAILYNNLTCPKRIKWVQGSTHGYVPSERHAEFTVEKGM